MLFQDVANLLGKRIDSDEVVAFATALGVKLPLKPTTDGDSRGFFSVKKLGLEVGYSHDITTATHYPPQKVARKYVCYVNTIWFEPAHVTHVPAGLHGDAPAELFRALPGATLSTNRLAQTVIEWPLPERADAILRITIAADGSAAKRWTLSLQQHNRLHYCKSSAKAHAFTPWNPAWPDEQADLPIGMFMAWAIHRGLVGERHLRERPDLVAAVQARTMTGREFLYQAAFHNELWSWDLAPALHAFAHSYVHCLCHRNSTQPLLGRADRCGPDDDFMAVFDPLFPGRGLSAADDWINFDRFAVLLDARYADFLATNLATQITDAAQVSAIANIYQTAASAMAVLPAPVELAGKSVAGASAPMPVTESLTAELLGLLGQRTDEAAVIDFCKARGLTIPAVAGSTAVEAPTDGYFIQLTNPWSHKRLGPAVAAADKARWQRKKIKLVETIEVTAAGHEHLSSATGTTVLCAAYAAALPLGLSLSQDLAAVDALLGPDEFNAHSWATYKHDGTLTRRWGLAEVAGAPVSPEGFVLLINFKQHRVQSVRIVLR